jgi:hypothetical protein
MQFNLEELRILQDVLEDLKSKSVNDAALQQYSSFEQKERVNKLIHKISKYKESV